MVRGISSPGCILPVSPEPFLTGIFLVVSRSVAGLVGFRKSLSISLELYHKKTKLCYHTH